MRLSPIRCACSPNAARPLNSCLFINYRCSVNKIGNWLESSNHSNPRTRDMRLKEPSAIRVPDLFGKNLDDKSRL